MDTQTHPNPAPVETDQVRELNPIRVQQALEEVLASSPFRTTQQCQNLLRYIVKHTLAQEEHLLRERVIGAEVFGRRPDYETGDDPVVRIRAAEVRKRLAQFYQSVSDSPLAPEVQIEIPSGSYRATFRWREVTKPLQDAGHVVHHGQSLAMTDFLPADIQPAATTTLQPGHLPALTAETIPAKRRVKLFAMSAVLVLAIAGWLIYIFGSSPQTHAFRQFWQPFTSSSRHVIIAVGSNAVYRISPQLADQYAHEHNLETEGMEFFVPIDPSAKIDGVDIQPAPNSFVALGDVASISDIVATLTQRGQAFQERFPNDISFAELRGSPTILVGGFNNPMSIELTKYLPFVLRARNEIDDTGSSGRRWMLHASTDSHHTEDYAIVTRLMPHDGEAPVMSLAGMGQYGTLAAAGFVCNPASLTQLAHQLPKGWENRNLQVVLHIQVLDFKPTSTDVVAVRSW